MTDALLLAGGISDRRNAKALADALAKVGMRARVSQAGALRLWVGENRYEFDGSNGDYVLADPGVESLNTLLSDVPVVTSAMERVGARCRFEIYEGETLVSYHHVLWPEAERVR